MKNKKVKYILGLLTIMLIAVISISNKTVFADLFNKDEIQEKQMQIISTKDRNDVLLNLGEALNKAVIPGNELIIAYVNDEPIFLNEFNYYKAFDQQKAKELNELVPNNRIIFDQLVKRKINVELAKKQGLYPSEKDINNYINEQKEMMKNKEMSNDLFYILKGWQISENEYFDLMKGIWADSIAISNWFERNYAPLLSITEDQEKDEKANEIVMQNSKVEIVEQQKLAKIVITDGGRELGL